MRKALLAFAMASGLIPVAALAQNTTPGGTTSGPAAGTNVQPGTGQGQGTAPNPSGAVGAGAPGTAAQPGTEAGPSPGQQAQGMPGQGMTGQGMPGQGMMGQGMPGMPQRPSGMAPGREQPGMGREHAEMMRRMMHGMGPGWIGPGAFFRFRHEGNEIVIKCAADEPTQVCVQAATVLMELVMKQGAAQGGTPGGAPGQAH